ncbi:nuclear transport factor 2 family protein [Sphingobium sp.]|uniref:nuclear transport factor 2 family protein n=1 Tax=Sphingobium sp. TaxID=1912891 RepID=UPI0028BE8E74|nr:nuclear transport factor 2 family protein [Sphingobium sp.]
MSSEERNLAIDNMLAKNALNDLVMRFCRAADRRDYDLLRTFFHDDAVYKVGNVFSGSVDECLEWLSGAMEAFELTNHFVCNASYRIDGDRADGELYFIAYHRTIGAELIANQRTSSAEPKHLIVTGRYLDNYECRHGEWKLACRHLAWDAAFTAEVAEADARLLQSFGETGGLENDLSYRALPLMARGR